MSDDADRPVLGFFVVVNLKNGTVIRYSTSLGVSATIVFCRDLSRWLLGSRPLGYRSAAGEQREITSRDVESIDLVVDDGTRG